MAFRKEKIRQQFGEYLDGGILEPGEQVESAVFLQTGPSPWFAGAFGILIYKLLGAKWGYFAVTDRRALLVSASVLSQRPKALTWADPRSEVRVTDVAADATIWNKFLYHRPGGGKPVRMNVHRIWRDELQPLVAALGPQTGAA